MFSLLIREKTSSTEFSSSSSYDGRIMTMNLWSEIMKKKSMFSEPVFT